MADKESDDSHKSSARSRDDNETHRGWKSKWVESASPRADHSVDEEETKGHNVPGNDNLRDDDEETT